jgi:hypothetical protein
MILVHSDVEVAVFDKPADARAVATAPVNVSVTVQKT